MNELEQFERLLDSYRNAVEAYSSTPPKSEDWQRCMRDARHYRHELMDLVGNMIDDLEYSQRFAGEYR